MVKGQGDVDNVFRLHGQAHMSKAAVGLQPLFVVDHGGFGQARGTGGEYVQGNIAQLYGLGQDRVGGGELGDGFRQVDETLRRRAEILQGVGIGQVQEVAAVFGFEHIGDSSEVFQKLLAHHEQFGAGDV